MSCTFPPVMDVAFISVPGFGPTYSGTLDVSSRGDGCYTIRANAVGCSSDPRRGGIVTNATPVPSVLVNTPPDCLTIPLRRPSDTSGFGWASDLGLHGGRLQVVVNGSLAFAGDGRAYGTSGLAAGENRVEAMVVEGHGKPGLWRFEALGSQVVPGSLRVISGEALAVAGTSVTFRLRGTPGERVVVTFTRR